VDLAAAVPAGVAAVLELAAIVPTVVAAVRVSMPVAPAGVSTVCVMAMTPSTVMLPGFVTPAIAIPIAMVVSAVPRAGSDEDSVHEVARSVVAIRRAGVRIRVVVSIVTNRRPRNIRMPNDDAYRAHANSN
jgi:hypothetical protein